MFQFLFRTSSTIPRKLVVPWNMTLHHLRQHQLRGDTIIALSIPIACIGVFIEAYYRTDYDDADTSLDAQFLPSNECIDSYNYFCHTTNTASSFPSTAASAEIVSLSDLNKNTTNKNTIVQSLERDGIVIIPNAISPTLLLAVRENIHLLQQQQQQKQGETTLSQQQPFLFATSGNDSDVRQDKIVWIRRRGSDARSCCNCDTTSSPNTTPNDSDLELGKGTSLLSTKNDIGRELEYCIDFVRGIPYALEKNGYTLSNHHRIPKQCQLSMYSGDNISSYQRHLDTCTSTIYDLGLLEFLRLSDYRQRRITIILYLNESNRPIHHGGTLRCWVSKELSQSNDFHSPSQSNLSQEEPICKESSTFYPSFDIQPKGGTLVIFQSHR